MNQAKQQKGVLLFHSGRQHSHQTALALAQHDLLSRYISGVPANRQSVPLLVRSLLARQIKAYQTELDADLCEFVPIATMTRHLAAILKSRSLKVSLSHRADAWFDRYTARRLRRLRGSIVICYENSAEQTFIEARKRGMSTILDAASFHHAWQDRFSASVETRSVHERITNRKDREIQLADYITTVSEFARQSYLEAGVDPDKVVPIPMGVDLSRFDRQPHLENYPVVRFIFVGHINEHKGADILCDAVKLLEENGVEFELSLVGKPASSVDFNNFRSVKQLGWIPQADLSSVLAQHDVLVLPSRFDSFGMVVAEGMAMGLPAIVSDHVGAREMVTEQVTGLVVPAFNASKLSEAMQWFIDNRHRLPRMKSASREVAERYDWKFYRERFVQFIQRVLGANPAVDCA